MAKCALITGITGQDGSYLTELLLEKGYEVHGIIRRSSSFNTERLDHLNLPRFHLHYGDLTDATSLRCILEHVKPVEIYNLGAQSHVRVSFDMPEYTADVVAMGALRLLEASRDYRDRTGIDVRIYQASSSEMYGKAPPPQTEATPFYPCSPYGCAKVAAYHFGVNYRDAYGMHVSNGILFNHESPRRGETFLSRKVTRAVGRIKEGLQDELVLGNLSAKRDWGYAGDFVRAMWMMLQQDEPGDHIVATGVSHSVKDFVEAVFKHAGLNAEDHVQFDSRYLRPMEVDHLEGDASSFRKATGWSPEVSFDQLVKMMYEHDLVLAKRERVLRNAGHDVTAGVTQELGRRVQ